MLKNITPHLLIKCLFARAAGVFSTDDPERRSQFTPLAQKKTNIKIENYLVKA